MLRLLFSCAEPQDQNLLSTRYTHQQIKPSATKLWKQIQSLRSSPLIRPQVSRRWCVRAAAPVQYPTVEKILKLPRRWMNCLTPLICQVNLQTQMIIIFLRLFYQILFFIKNQWHGKMRLIMPFRKVQDWFKFKNGKIFSPGGLDIINMEKLAGPIGHRLSIWLTSGLPL